MVPAGEKLSVLIVDDEIQVRNVMAAVIGAKFPQISFYCADDGGPGLELFKLHAPQLVITDLAMPGMDGISMAAEIKRLEPKTVIVAVTGHTHTNDLLRAIEIGIDHYLLKPSFLDKLSAIISQFIAAKTELASRERLERALRLSEQRLLVTIQNSPVTVSSQDLELRYTWVCNGQMGCSSDVMLGNTDRDLFPGEAVLPILEIKRQAIAQRSGVRDEVKVPRGQAVYWYDLSVEPLYDTRGEMIGITNIMVDISKRKQAEERILELNANLERRVRDRTARLKAAIREQEAFSYTVSHDLRAPLRHISSFSTLLIDDFGEAIPEQARGYLDRIRKTAIKMGSMIDHLLELSRISRTEMKQERVDLSAVARSIATMLQETEPERSVDFVIEEGLFAQGDHTLIRQLVQNLFSNAWKYSSGTSRARIELGRVTSGDFDGFFVKDNGAGFDMAHSGQLFAIFQRLHGGEFEGMGIGLAIVHRIIQRHNGSIWAEGKVNEGATFYFSLGSATLTSAQINMPMPNREGQLSFSLGTNC
jgi:PAS domain S-box-containing protein